MTMRVGIVALAVGLLWPSAAAAATLGFDGPGVVYEAAPGETNALDVRLDGATMVFTDTGAVITPLAGFCISRSAGVVACDFPSQPYVEARLGDGGDLAVLILERGTVDGGEGDDHLALHAVNHPGMLEGRGGPGNDTLVGASGDTTMSGGDGDDTITVASGQGFVKGDGGNDALSASAPGSLLGGNAGDDTLTGSPGRDSLNGGTGADTIQAGDGDDFVHGNGDWGHGEGADRIDAGPGNDSVQGGGQADTITGGPGTDLIDCGPGRDAVAPDSADRVRLSCELLEQAVSCPARWRAPCRAVGVLTRRGDVLGRGVAAVPSATRGIVRVKVSPTGRARVRLAELLVVRLGVTVSAGKRSRGPVGTLVSLVP